MNTDTRWIELLRLREKLKRNLMLSMSEQRWLAWEYVDPLPHQPDDKTMTGLNQRSEA